eukprot:CAMPEP_0113936410 /NCGR_PEP_ID=MMETSP1339-20121228/3333_1 /TAXON_ID=94617 /ORGANISM="Fibrocapsa japonica" /LENGTH=53 /DNA_ID=CAMNT_0000938879 /DNA_START=74 /DNA_END=235 /DNA_ORIENTATION=+ /assembly_acc=CAM_ASM_000762
MSWTPPSPEVFVPSVSGWAGSGALAEAKSISPAPSPRVGAASMKSSLNAKTLV